MPQCSLFVTPKFSIGIVFSFSWELKWPQEKLKTIHVEILLFAFYGGGKKATTNFSFSLYSWMWFLGIQLQESSPTFDKVSEFYIVAM